MRRTLGAYGIAAVAISVAWLGLESGPTHARQAVYLVLLALLPGLAILLRRGNVVAGIVLAGTSLLAFASAFDRPLSEAQPRSSEHNFFGPVLHGIGQGFRDTSDVPSPFDPSTYAGMHGLVMLAIFGFCVGAGLAIASRRTGVALGVVIFGTGVPLTMQSPTLASGDALTLGALVLVAALGMLALMRPGGRGLGYAAVGAAILVAAAVGASSSNAVAKTGFVNWDSWDWYDKPAEPVDVSYVWNGSYDGIDFPNKKTTVLEITVPGKKRSLYWRATTLDDYTGTIWREDEGFRQAFAPGQQVNVGNADDTNVPEEILNQKLVRQDVTVKALKDRRLVGSAQALRWSINKPTALALNDAVSATSPLGRDDRYSVWSYVSDATPKELSKAGTSYPAGIMSTYLVPETGTDPLPSFGSPQLETRLDDLFAAGGALASHRALLAAAERETQGATSPYAAAVLLERWLRTAGGFRYTEHPGSSGTEPALVKFMQSKAGYCQHFAGAMALMLRYLGIPSRVAAGFTSGSYDAHSHKWTVTDHNAHTWVEVYFPHYGWLQFDPTPDRGELSEPYSTASPAFDAAEAAALSGLGVIKGSFDRGGGLAGREGAAASGGPVGAVAGKSRGIVGIVVLLLIAAGAALLLLKEARRRIRFLARDPRRLATAYRRDLVGYLVDQGYEVPRSATPDELSALTQSLFGVSGSHFAHAVAEARYGRPAQAPATAKRARTELGRLRRHLRSRLSTMQRVRGAFRFRSLTV
jgi:Transglutaminase-like superfamily/TgpA N-terminal domain